MTLEQVRHRVDNIKLELIELLGADEFNFPLIQEKADTLNELITSIHPFLSVELVHADWLRDNALWLDALIKQLSLARDDVAAELVKLNRRKKADKYYGENT